MRSPLSLSFFSFSFSLICVLFILLRFFRCCCWCGFLFFFLPLHLSEMCSFFFFLTSSYLFFFVLLVKLPTSIIVKQEKLKKNNNNGKYEYVKELRKDRRQREAAQTLAFFSFPFYHCEISLWRGKRGFYTSTFFFFSFFFCCFQGRVCVYVQCGGGKKKTSFLPVLSS